MRRSHGFAYIALLVVLAVLMLVLGKAAEEIELTAQREREAQLLFVGMQFRNAIASYYESSPTGNKQYPKSLSDLLLDNRFPKPVRHLRRIYADPMRKAADWGLVRNEQGMLVGVYSLSDSPVLGTHFDQGIETGAAEGGALRYSDLKFIYRPGNTQDRAVPDAQPNDDDAPEQLLE